MLNKNIRNKIFEYVTKNLGMRKYTRDWLKGTCPNCGRIDKFGVNLTRNRTNCFVCGFNPTPAKLIMDLEGFTEFRELLSFLGTFKGRLYLDPIVERIERVDVKLPEGYTNILFGKSLLARQARKYIRSRGFEIDEVAYKGWGYCTSGPYLGYIIMPFYVGNKLFYFNGRRYLGSGPKYNNPKIEDFGIGKSLIIYNLDALSVYDEISLVEGVINADTLGDNAVASGGKKISHYQISAILKSPVEKVNILLDPDAIADSIKIGLEMVYHKKIRIVTWDGDKDINDIGREEVLKRISKVDWQSYNDLLKMKHNLR